jgi:hypothetical protein
VPGGGAGLFLGRRGLEERQPDDELRSAPEAAALGGHRSAVKLGDPLHQREPEAKAAFGPRQRRPALDEGLEQVREQIRLDARAGVLDADLGLSVVSVDRQRHLSRPDP